MINTVSRYQDEDKAMLTIMAKLTVLPQHDWSSRAPQSRMECTSFFSASALLKASLNGKYGTFQKRKTSDEIDNDNIANISIYLLNNYSTNITKKYMSWKNICSPVEKSSIYWLGVFWRMAAGLSWSWAGASCLGPAHDQLKPAQISSHASKHTLSAYAVFLTGHCCCRHLTTHFKMFKYESVIQKNSFLIESQGQLTFLKGYIVTSRCLNASSLLSSALQTISSNTNWMGSPPSPRLSIMFPCSS